MKSSSRSSFLASTGSSRTAKGIIQSVVCLLVVLALCAGCTRDSDNSNAPTTTPASSPPPPPSGNVVSGLGAVTIGSMSVKMVAGEDAPVTATVVAPTQPASDELVALAKNAGLSNGPIVQFDAASADIAQGATISATFDTPLGTDSTATLAYWDPDAEVWQAVPSVVSNDRSAVSANVTHFSWWTDIISDADHAVGQFFDTRVDRPSCESPAPSWIQSDGGIVFLDDQNAPLVWCAGHDPARPELLVVKVRVNRGYGMAIHANADSTWSWNSYFQQNVGDLMKAIVADSEKTVSQFISTVLTGGQLVPGGAEVDFGFSEAQVRAAQGGGVALVEVAKPNLTELAVSIIVKQLADKVSDKAGKGVAYAIAFLGLTHCLTGVALSDDPARLAGALTDCAASGKATVALMEANQVAGLAKYMELPEKEVADKAVTATKRFFALITLANIAFQAASYYGDVSLDDAARQLSAFPTIAPPTAKAAVAMTADNLATAQMPDRFGIPAGPMTNGSREGGNGGVEGLTDVAPSFGDFTGDGVPDAAAAMEGSSGVGGTYGWVALFTDGGQNLGNWNGTEITQARMQVTAMSITDGGVTVDWTAQDNAHPFVSTWRAVLSWNGTEITAQNVTMLTSDSGGQPVDPAAFDQDGRQGHYWQSPSGNITCTMDLFGGQARCLINQIDYTGPPGCAAGPIYAALDETTGLATTACGGDQQQLPAPPKKLEFGQSISEFSTACVSADKGMTCKDETTGHGFTLSRTGLDQF